MTNFVTHAREANAKPRNMAVFGVGKGRAMRVGMMNAKYTVDAQGTKHTHNEESN